MKNYWSDLLSPDWYEKHVDDKYLNPITFNNAVIGYLEAKPDAKSNELFAEAINNLVPAFVTISYNIAKSFDPNNVADATQFGVEGCLEAMSFKRHLVFDKDGFNDFDFFFDEALSALRSQWLTAISD